MRPAYRAPEDQAPNEFGGNEELRTTVNEPYDVLIIGGGPAGLACALYAARARHRTVVLDGSSAAGALANAAKVANYPGVSGPVPGAELLGVMRKQAAEFGAEYVRKGVTSVDFASEPRLVCTSDELYAGRAVVVATGALGRKTRVPGEEEFLGRGVSYCATCDAAFFAGQDVAVIGDSDVALEDALFLTRFASVVHLVAPRRELRAERDLAEAAAREEKIRIHYGARLREIAGDGALSQVLVTASDGADMGIPVSGVFVHLTGTAPTTDFLAGALPLTDEGCIVVDADKSTPVAGVYAVGDVTCKRTKQAVIAAADGVVAALAIDQYLNKRSRIKLDYE